ncbi:MAG TPA: N-acetylgalactosamine-6-sulfatase [Balneolaceae bacterium]|nr:N-acetylgalactosamine-6-sulfatase [Balneolaceae bacterium]|tara:strand:- start:71231 stop:72604 length:1374 start_codon:yes stop_codon:yes gene_type:complete
MYRLSILVLIGFITSCSNPEPTSELPNIIHVFVDDLGYGDVGAFGATDIKTPNIDRIADEGIKFTEFYSASSICSPSRAALLTGRYPQRMGIGQVFFPESFTGMPEEEITIAELLKKKEYATAIVGKWHLGHRKQYLPLNQGFDYYFGIPYSNDMESVVYMRGNEVVDFEVDQHYTTKTYTREAIDFIEREKDNPFFLYLAHSMPHVPIYASEQFEGTSERGLYGDVVQELDWSVGQIIQKLEDEKLLENTLLIFSSDNGPWLVMEDHGGSAGPLREGKQFTFEGGMRVPTVAMWKGKIVAGKVYEDLATQMDWFPTIAQMVGVPVPDDREIDGKDLSAVLFSDGERDGDTFFYFDDMELQAYRSGDYKVKKPYSGFPGAAWKQKVPAHDSLLINLKEDMGEQHNLYPEQPDFGISLFEEMNQARKELGAFPAPLIIRTGADNSHYRYLEQKHKQEK